MDEGRHRSFCNVQNTAAETHASHSVRVELLKTSTNRSDLRWILQSHTFVVLLQSREVLLLFDQSRDSTSVATILPECQSKVLQST
jgi:hypothetical protein